MILVDTSVWIDFIRGRETNAVTRLRTVLGGGAEVAITSPIYQEILQGAADEKTYRDYRLYFSTQQFLQPLEAVTTYEHAARLYFNCRRKGLTIRSSTDCLIAQIGIEHQVALLHDDRNFEKIAIVAPRLRFV